MLAGLILTLICFYFWASSTNYPPDKYDKIVHFANPSKAQKDTFSIISFNIGYLSGMANNLPGRISYDSTCSNLKNAIKAINSFSPDFIGFQEIDFLSHRSYNLNQFDSIGKGAGFSSGAMAINWDKKYVPYPYWPPSTHFGRILSGQGLLSKFKILENRITVLPKPLSNPFYYNAFYIDRLIQVATIQITPELRLMIINVHFEAYDIATREIDSNILISYLKNIPQGHPYIVLGDFNSRPPYKSVSNNSEKTIKNLLELKLMPAIDETIYEDNPGKYYTFDSERPVEMIDYMFYNPGDIMKIDAGVIRNTGKISDHFPVYMKFIFKN